jgi:3-oxoacyl-ACP reductase-like protein
MAEKKATTKKAAETKEAKAPAAKKATATKKAAVKAEATVVVNAEDIGFRAGDVYQALAAAEKALNVKEIAKAAKISEEETLLGLGWLFKEGKLLSTDDNKIVLA